MPKFSKSIPEGVRLLQHCPVCQSAYPKGKEEILEEKAESRLLHLTCAKCRHTVLVLVASTSFGVSSVGMLTDLNFLDSKRLLDKKEISEEELFSFHQLLKTNQFNFKY